MTEVQTRSGEEVVALEDARRFVEANRVSANDNGIECGDGRYTPQQSIGRLRIFGADIGIIVAIVSAVEENHLGKFPSQCVDLYLQAIREIRGTEAKIHYHSDEEHLRDFSVGCRDIAQAQKSEHAQRYGGSPSGVVLTHSYIKTLDAHSSHETVLQGKHAEKGVLLIESDEAEESPEWSVDSFDQRTNESYFVIDIGRAKKFIREVIPLLGINGLRSESVEAAFLQRTKATLTLLGEPTAYIVRFQQDGTMDVIPSKRE